VQQTVDNRYTKVAVILHWLLAVLIILMMAAGIWMADAIDVKETRAAAFDMFQLHKSVGLSILALSLFRLGWRLTHRQPAMPASIPAWERMAAHATHWLFYALMIGLPITGWLMVSASPLGLPTLYFGGAEMPHFPALAALDYAGKELWEERFEEIHELIAYGGIALIILHLGAALKHHFIVRDDILVRMLPFLKAPIPHDSEEK
jgi:cytochrome b561